MPQFVREKLAELIQQHRDMYGDQTIGGFNPGQIFDRYLKHPDMAGVWVAEMDTLVIGFSGLLVSGEEAQIEPVIVAKQCRAHGIGRTLIAHLIQEARLRGIRFLSVRPVARNVVILIGLIGGAEVGIQSPFTLISGDFS